MSRRLRSAAAESRQAGFTLLELVVAVTLLGFLSVGLFAAVKVGLRAWERGVAHTSAMDEVRLVRSLLRHQLSLAYPRFDSDGVRQPQVRFDGRPDRITFLGPAPAALGRAGLVEIALRSVASGAGQELRLEIAPAPAGDVPPAAVGDVLIDRLAAVDMAYFGIADSRDAAQWHDRWTDQRRPPALVRVRARFHPGDVREWPDLVVAPRVAVDQGCVLDLATGGCRGR